MEKRILALYSETNIHTGTGQSTGAIDLPVDRERHTGFPVMASSGLKGALRELGETKWGKKDDRTIILFGPSVDEKTKDHAGALSVSQANLLAFPVRCLTNVFQWVTCPMVLGRLARDLKLAEINDKEFPSIQVDEGKGKSYKDDVILEDIQVSVDEDENAHKVIEEIVKLLPDGLDKDRFKKNLIIISDNDFRYLVKHTTEVRARIALNDRKTTDGDGGNLWYEETLPRDCLFYSLVRCMDSMDGNKDNNGKPKTTSKDVEKHLKKLLPEGSYLRVGGNETVGMGWCAVKTYGGE